MHNWDSTEGSTSVHVVITKEVQRHPICTHTCSHMRGLYRDFVYPSYRMCHRWWNLNCKIHIKLSYDGPSAAPSSFIESRLMHVYISRLTHICVKVSNRKRRIDRVHRRRRHIAKDRTLRQKMSIMLISLRNVTDFHNFWYGLLIRISLSYIFHGPRVISSVTLLFLFILILM